MSVKLDNFFLYLSHQQKQQLFFGRKGSLIRRVEKKRDLRTESKWVAESDILHFPNTLVSEKTLPYYFSRELQHHHWYGEIYHCCMVWVI